MDEQPPSAPSGGNADADKPLEERLVSKAWLTRAEAFQELGSKFKAAKPNCADDTFREHSTNWAKFLADINPGALEKALDCFAAYLDKVQPALLGDTQITCFKPLVEKCLGHAKPAIKGKALENFLLIFEVSEKFDEDTTDAIEALCKHKVIKVSKDLLKLQFKLGRPRCHAKLCGQYTANRYFDVYLVLGFNQCHWLAFVPNCSLWRQEDPNSEVCPRDSVGCELFEPRCPYRSHELLQELVPVAQRSNRHLHRYP